MFAYLSVLREIHPVGSPEEPMTKTVEAHQSDHFRRKDEETQDGKTAEKEGHFAVRFQTWNVRNELIEICLVYCLFLVHRIDAFSSR